jgi:hypothetical protein
MMLHDDIAIALKSSTVGMKVSELRRNVRASENHIREAIKQMVENRYLQKTGVCNTTRYSLTPQGRLRFISGNESPLTQTEKTPVETVQPAPIVEESPLEQIVNNELGKLADIKYADDSISRGMCSVASKQNEIEIKPYPFVADSVIEEVETCSTIQTNPSKEPDAGAHYRFQYQGINLDPFRIAQVYEMDDFCMMTILKKTLCAGRRGHKDFEQDLKDIICAAQRKLEMLREDSYGTT